MWLLTSTFICFVLCLECPLLVNVAAAADAELTSSLLGRAQDCSSDTDCTIDNTTCTDGYCECVGGYIYDTNMTACLLAATAYGDPCTETSQCSAYFLSGSVCADGICKCDDGHHYTRGSCHASSALGESCSADVNCYVNADTEATSCVNGVCVCTEGFYQREHRTCRRASYAEGGECAIDHDCRFENGVCNSSYVCAISTTNTTRTAASNLYEIEDDSRVVRSVARADENATIGTECVSDDNCTAVANSICGPAGTCICDRAYFASEDLDACIAEMGEDCSNDDEVSVTNSLCREGAWSCGYATVASISQRICRKTTKNYNWSCLHDEQCYIFGPDSSCQNKRCLCNEGSHLVDDEKFCWVSRGLSESCIVDEDCHVEGLELSCTNSVCSCPEGSSPNADNTKCKSDVIGGACDEDDDCTVKNALCIDSLCACPENYFDVNNYCAAGVNATCSADSDCDVANSTCTEDNVCGCVESHVPDGIESCLPVKAHGEECESDVQCTAVLSNSHCSAEATTSGDSNSTTTSSCLCESDYHYRFDVCNAKTALGESCSSLGDCYVESGIEDVVCRKGVCACTWSSTSTGTGCSRVSSDATTFFLSIWTTLFLLGVKIVLV